MYHDTLEKDLKAIFGVKKVLYGSPALGKEQDVLFCSLAPSRINIKPGKESAIVSGSISIIGLLGKNQSGFIHKRIGLANKELTNKFWFSPKENPYSMSTFEERFNVYEVDFQYFYKKQYNPPAGFITAAKYILKVIGIGDK